MTGVRSALVAHRRRRMQRGTEIMEFALVLAPFLAMVTVLVDISWGIFAKSTLQRAVRTAVEQGVSLSQTNLAQNACLTDTVKSIVQQNSLGLLSGSTGIYVNYLQPPAPGSSGAATDVSTQSDADNPGNIMQVSVQNFSLAPMLPRIYNFNQSPDSTPFGFSVYAAGVIQLTSETPCVGSAP
jgi:Flp pilus assembly protein TadG